MRCPSFTAVLASASLARASPSSPGALCPASIPSAEVIACCAACRETGGGGGVEAHAALRARSAVTLMRNVAPGRNGEFWFICCLPYVMRGDYAPGGKICRFDSVHSRAVGTVPFH